MADVKKIIAILGKSGAGKTAIANILKENGVPPVVSHTTRAKRYETEDCHQFHTEGQYKKITGKIAETIYGGHKYCGTLPDIESDIYSYVIDEVGVRMLLEDPRFDVKTVLVLANDEDRKQRTTEERYNRDKDIKFSIRFDEVILNIHGLDGLKNQTLKLIEK